MTESRREGRREYRGSRKSRGLNFRFFLLCCALLTASAVFVLYVNQSALDADIKTRKVEEETHRERALQKDLRMKLARLKSPGRIARIAIDELGMTEPDGVIYLKYRRGATGGLSCESTFERRKAPRENNDAAQIGRAHVWC